MKEGHLSEYFLGVAAKTLKATEVDRETSHGHEYQGVDAFREFLGSPTDKQSIQVTYVWLSDEEAPLKVAGLGTWYDSRKNQLHRVPEYRLYYPKAAEDVVYRAEPGDTLFFCLRRNGHLLAISCPAGSTIEHQLFWLFGLRSAEEFKDNQHDLRTEAGVALDYTARYILELIEIEVAVTEDQWLDRLIKRFGTTFPPTADFSRFAQENLADVDGVADPDGCLMARIDFEEKLFRTFERYVVGDRLKAGFMNGDKADVDGFVSFSLSVQNRRKSRAGAAFEHHLEALFGENSVRYIRGAETENRNRPDFLFPGVKEYRDDKFPAAGLTMLAAKSTCKDRWRQALSEAARIDEKHLVTLEPSISENQTDEMKAKKLRLIVPSELQKTYKSSQMQWLMKVADFIKLVQERQQKT
jgi:restriction endonuclease EcoRII-like protein